VKKSPALLGFAAFSGTGKTTLLEQLIPLLRARGLRIAAIKHAHHDFDIDYPGKDSYRLRKAGATQTLVASNRRWALITEHGEGLDEPNLLELLTHIDTEHVDLVLVEGFKHETFPRIELHRPSLGHPTLFPNDANIIAIACDEILTPAPPIPMLDLNHPQAVASFIIATLKIDSGKEPPT